MRKIVLLLLFVAATFAGRAALAETVPDVTGLAEAEARSLLEQAGFRIVTQYAADQPAGLVFAQEPLGWSQRPRGTAVEMRVGGANPGAATPPPTAPAAGEAPFTDGPPPSAEPPASPDGARVFPQFVGLAFVEARSLAAAFNPRFERALVDASQADFIVRQWPPAETAVDANVALTLVVGVAELPSPRHASVPDATGLSLAEATRVFAAAGFNLRNIGPANDGIVVMHHPLGGSLAIRGAGIEAAVEAMAATPSNVVAPNAPRGRDVVRVPARAPELRSPAEGESYPMAMPVVFDWSPTPGAAAYEWQIVREIAGGRYAQVLRERATALPLSRSEIPRGRLLWRVRAVGSEGAGPWSPARRLYVY